MLILRIIYLPFKVRDYIQLRRFALPQKKVLIKNIKLDHFYQDLPPKKIIL